MLVQIVQNHFRHFTALEINHQTHTRLVAFVLDVADALNLLLVNELGHALLKCLFINLIRQFIHDDGLALTLVDVFEMALCTHHDSAPSRAIAIFHTIDSINNSARGKVWCWDDFHQFINGCLRMFEQMQAGIHHFIQVVRGNVGGHAHCNATGAVDQQVGQAGWHDQWFLLAAIVVGAEVNRFLVQICQQFVGNL